MIMIKKFLSFMLIAWGAILTFIMLIAIFNAEKNPFGFFLIMVILGIFPLVSGILLYHNIKQGNQKYQNNSSDTYKKSEVNFLPKPDSFESVKTESRNLIPSKESEPISDTNIISKSDEKSNSTDNPVYDDFKAPIFQEILIEFTSSTSKSFEFAIIEAKKFQTFQEIGEGKKAVYRVTVSRENVISALELVSYISNWKNSSVYLDGKKVPFDSVFGFSYCAKQREASYKPEYYCYGYENQYLFNLWGCNHASLHFLNYTGWFTYGMWLNKNGDWKFDKARIRHELEKNLYRFRFCPFINYDNIVRIINALPDMVNPHKDRNWKFSESFGDSLSEEYRVKIKQSDGYEEIINCKGVMPNGKGYLREIAEKVNVRGLSEFIN